ncbi:hypothetical protein ASZ90_019744 [hydrocarbon metagenome]|uniref:Uncharacterized protein n=1 Tax=hydrocarbon metagenome TaxID=938273 RepID=A0A0W8E2P6_9ZZZZ
MFWETTSIVITLPMFLTYFCSLSSNKRVQLLPAVIFGIILVGAVITWLVYPSDQEISKSLGFTALVALCCSLLTRAIIKEVYRIRGSFER